MPAELRHTARVDGVDVRFRAAGRPRNDHGVGLDPGVARFLRVLGWTRLRGQPGTGPAEVERARAEQRLGTALIGVPLRRMASVETTTVPGPDGAIPVRVYQPEDGAELLPLLVYLHGGGFVLGDPGTHEGVCRTLAADARCVVVSVDYRLAPEHPFPAGLDDADAAFTYLREHARRFGGRSDRVAIVGDSAGACLATQVCQRLQTRGEAQPLVQGLIYPCTDLRRVHPSHQRFAAGYLLTSAMLDWFVALYLPDPALAASPEVSPLLAAPEQLAGLATAMIETAGFDPLRDEGWAYAAALRAAGVAVEHRCHARLIHGYVNLGGVIPAARVALEGLADRLRVAVHAPHGAEVRT